MSERKSLKRKFSEIADEMDSALKVSTNVPDSSPSKAGKDTTNAGKDTTKAGKDTTKVTWLNKEKDTVTPVVTDMSDAGGSSLCYDMKHKHRGLAVIVNNREFDKSTRMAERVGTENDCSRLETEFRKLKFDVELHDDLSSRKMLKLMKKLAKDNHAENDCFAAVFLSHGDEGVVYGTDGKVYIDELVEPFKYCSSLAAKPKLFFFQACQGKEVDHGMELPKFKGFGAKAPKKMETRIPVESDFLLAYAATPGYISWRNEYGSWFIQSLCDVLRDWGTQLEILHILTRVCYQVAYHYQTNTGSALTSGKKQSPQIVSTLTKQLYFKPFKM